MQTPTLRPLTTGELLDRTFSLYRNHFVLFAGIVALPHLVMLALDLVGAALFPQPQNPWTFDMGRWLLWTPFYLVVMLAVTSVAQGGSVVAVSYVYLGRSITVTESLRTIRPRLVPLALTMVLQGVLVLLVLVAGFLVVGAAVATASIPAILMATLVAIGTSLAAVYLSLGWALTIPAAVLENLKLMGAITRSARLTRGDRSRVFVVYLLFVLLLFIVAMVINVPVFVTSMSTAMAGGPMVVPAWMLVYSAVTNFVTQCLVAPLMTIGFAVMYYDERVRKEAFDLELMMTAIDGAVPAPSAVPPVSPAL